MTAARVRAPRRWPAAAVSVHPSDANGRAVSRALPHGHPRSSGLAAAALGACGGPPGDAVDARAAVETLLAACAEGQATTALETLTEPARRAFARGGGTAESCSEALGLELASLSPEEAARAFEEARVSAVEASGGIASATVEVAGRSREVEVERVGGRWLVNDPAVPT
nr:hypothetical protein [Actinomycetota bacterium]